MGHNEKLCGQRRHDVDQNCVQTAQCGFWLRARMRSNSGEGAKLNKRVSEMRELPGKRSLCPQGSEQNIGDVNRGADS